MSCQDIPLLGDQLVGIVAVVFKTAIFSLKMSCQSTPLLETKTEVIEADIETFHNMSNNIRKRTTEELQRPCLSETPEQHNKKLRGAKVMTGGEAGQVLFEFWASKPNDPGFPLLVKRSKDAIQQVRRGLNGGTAQEYSNNIIKSGLLSPIFYLLDLPRFLGGKIAAETIHVLQYEAAWILTNIANGDDAPALMNYHESLDILGRTLMDKTAAPNVREQAIWCVANLAGYEKGEEGITHHYCTQILNHIGVIQGLLDNTFRPANYQTLKTCLWTIGNVLLGKRCHASQRLVEAVLHTLTVAVKDENISVEVRHEILSEIFSALRKAMSKHVDVVDYVGKSETFVLFTIQVLEQARQHKNDILVHRIIRCLVLLLLHGNDEIHQSVTEHGFLAQANQLLHQSHPHTLQELCTGLASFVRKGDMLRIKKFRARGCLAGIVDVASNSRWQLKKEALVVLFVFLKVADQNGHLHFFQQSVGTHVLCDSLKTTMDIDVPLCRVALDAVEAILKTDKEHGGELSVCDKLRQYHGLDTIEQLQNHHMSDIQKKAVNIYEKYFVCDENEADDLEPDSPVVEVSRRLNLSPQSTPLPCSHPFKKHTTLFT